MSHNNTLFHRKTADERLVVGSTNGHHEGRDDADNKKHNPRHGSTKTRLLGFLAFAIVLVLSLPTVSDLFATTKVSVENYTNAHLNNMMNDGPVVTKRRQQQKQSSISAVSKRTAALVWPPPKSPYAYVFVLGGIDVDKPKYRIYLYGVYVTAYLLRKYGSTADFVLFYRILYSSPHEDLPQNELKALKKMNIITRKLPKVVEDFYNIQLTKFRALKLTQYRRVMYMDADFLPLGSIDYLFELSDENVRRPPLLRQNLVLLGTRAPSNGGLFMLSPKPGDLERINAVIQAKEMKIHRGGYFDNTTGWGEVMGYWNGTKGNGTGWTFIAASGDQGLLWYLVAFIKKQVSVVVPCDTIQNWAVTPRSKGQLVLKEVLRRPFSGPGFNFSWMQCREKPLSDVYHFMGRIKGPAKLGCKFTKWKSSQNKSSTNHWCYALKELSDNYDLGLDMLSVKEADNRTAHPNITRRFAQGGSLTDLLSW